jgi:hypothetical protein
VLLGCKIAHHEGANMSDLGQPNDPNNTNDTEAFERIFEQFADLLEFTVQNMDKPIPDNLPKNLEEKLVALEKDVNAFCELNNQLIERSKILGHGTSDTSHLTKRERRVIERSERLIKEAEEKLSLAEISEPEPKKGFVDPKERRKHVKRITRKKI